MPLTHSEIINGYRRKFGRDITEEDFQAQIRFFENFECMDCDTFEEAFEKVLVSMKDVSDEVNNAKTQEEAREVLRRRYSKLKG